MTANDPLSNALSGISNAESVGHLTHEVSPASNEIGQVLEVFYDRGSSTASSSSTTADPDSSRSN